MLTERHGCRRLSSRLSAVVAIWAGLAAADAAAQGSFEMDRAALEALYDATGGPTWVNSTNWKTSAPLGEWYGVETDADGRVTQLVLMENGLTGPIPAALASLVNLETLDLRNNGLTGPIPVALASLVNLEWLQLGGNALTGPIPATLASLVNLKKLDLWGNALTGPIPDWLGSLVNLERLSFSRNALSGPIPDALANLVNLEALYLYRNGLTGSIPAALGSLVNLDLLRLEENNFTGPLPASMTNLRLLEVLYIFDNVGLCAPADEAFLAWLATVDDFQGDRCEGPFVPGAPTGLMLTAGDGELTVSWTAPANEDSAITGYKVQWKSGDEAWNPNNREAQTMETSHRITGLSNGTSYTVRVAAVNALSTGAWSAVAMGIPVTPVPALPPLAGAMLALLLLAVAAASSQPSAARPPSAAACGARRLGGRGSAERRRHFPESAS